MLYSYLKIALRSLWNKKVFASINILGLAIGLATCMLILLFVGHELSYDRFHAHADRIFRVTVHGRIGGNEIGIASASAPAGPALMADYPGVEAYTRLDGNGTYLVKYGEKRFTEDRVVFVDTNFFDFFSLPLLKGDPKKILTDPKTVVITESTALKYFGDTDPIGKSLTMGDQGLFRITGICKDIPSNSHFHYDFFGPIQSVDIGDKWLSSAAHTYVRLREGYPVEKIKAQMPQLLKKYIGPEVQQFLGISYEEFLRKGDGLGFGFQPLTTIHLQSNLESELEANGNIKYIYIFTVIAAFILLIACINFMNLSTAGSAGRAKEVGVRKVMGSVRQQLMAQFLIESVLLTIFALVVAFLLVILLLPGFNDLAGKQFDIRSVLNPETIGYACAGCLVVGLLAGSYPAFFLSAFKPIAVLKGSIQSGVRSGWLRNALVTIQFVVSIGMIIGTMVVYQQLHFIQHKNVGFNKDQVLILHDTHLLGGKAKAFKEQLMGLSAVSSVTLAGYLPAGTSNNSTDAFIPENAGNNVTPYRFSTYQVDEDYLGTLGMGLRAGRNFSKSFGGDSASVLINEAAARQLGWKNPVGKRIRTLGNGQPETRRFYTVVGVTKDFHFRSMHERIAPLVMLYGGDVFQIAVRVKTNDMPGLLRQMETTWKANSDNPFTYSFLDERFNKMYESEMRIGKLFGIFASLAVVIACLGLFGLAAFTTIQRTKEIGVRKVLGASVLSIVSLLSKDFVKLVAVAILIATPIAWYGMKQWLSDFAYKVAIEWWVFVLAGLMAVVVALLTVSFQSIKAALVNPVKSLKSE